MRTDLREIKNIDLAVVTGAVEVITDTFIESECYYL